MEGFITRRGGASSEMKVVSSTFKGNGSTSITVPELAGCKAFYVISKSEKLKPTDKTTRNLSYFDGETTSLCVQGFYVGGSITTTYTEAFNKESFDAETGTITASGVFESGATYTYWTCKAEE